MNLSKQRLFARLLKPAGDDGSDTGGTGVIDRGDDFTPTDDDNAPAPAPAAAKETPAPTDAPKDDSKDEPKDDPKDEKKGAKDTRLPLARHKEILAAERLRREAVEAELANVKKGQAVATTNEQIATLEAGLTTLEEQYTNQLAEGQLKDAAATMALIRANERQIAQANVAFQTQAAEARAYERVRYDTMVDRLEEAYPELNEDDPAYDDSKMGEVMELQHAYKLTGLTPSLALQKAAKMIMGVATTRQKTAVESDVRVDKEDLAKATADERRKAAIAKNLDVAGKQPPSMKDVGVDSDKMGGGLNARDVIKMPQEQFNKLDEAQLAKMRGDEL